VRARVIVFAMTCLLLITGVACQDSGAGDRIRRLVNGIESASLAYQYKDETSMGALEIRGVIEDTFRHHEHLYIDGREVAEQVVNDDSLAVRILDFSAVPGGAGISGDASQTDTIQALLRGEWVVDPFGAPSLVRPPEGPAAVGQDPLADALNVGVYFAQAVDAAIDVVLFNPDSFDYRPAEDPFPRPKKAEGETRYDLARPPLPRQDDQTLPGAAPFRKMSLYVKGGQLVRVLEDINVAAHEDIKRARRNGRPEYLLDMVKAIRAGEGTERIRERRMEWIVLARDNVSITFPQTFVTGKLGPLFGSAPEQPAA
jgi:hypothetical protein